MSLLLVLLHTLGNWMVWLILLYWKQYFSWLLRQLVLHALVFRESVISATKDFLSSGSDIHTSKVNLVSGEDLLLWFIDSCPVTAHGQTDKGVLWGLFNKGINLIQGFPHSSVGKESACNAGDPGSMPGSGRSSGEGIGYSSILGLPWWLSW